MEESQGPQTLKDDRKGDGAHVLVIGEAHNSVVGRVVGLVIAVRETNASGCWTVDVSYILIRE